LSGSDEEPAVFEVLSSTFDETVIKFQLNEFYIDELEIKSNIYSKFAVPNLTTLMRNTLMWV
jgi:hypothetical protein